MSSPCSRPHSQVFFVVVYYCAVSLDFVDYMCMGPTILLTLYLALLAEKRTKVWLVVSQ